MAKKSARDRMTNEVNAGSMADIAFLLLIFFLVTTTIDVDKGVLVKLPPWSNEPPEISKMKTRNVYSVLVNAQNDLLVRGEPANIRNLRENAKEFIINPRKRDDMAEHPTKAIISIKNDRGTAYKTFLEVYNELKAAYNELRNEEAQRRFGKEFQFLNKDQQRKIRNDIPLVISEAEPTNFGEEN
ncbi:MAG: biopolymer transporter ExbD [Saprospiraceae bacterium]|nr:biopolymer transporter ExbD [Saprospiraceae bacterium]NNK90467.1 biopolymer transporter ExbD [Saprospiraceae bacterium]